MQSFEKFYKENSFKTAFFHGLSALQASIIVQLLHPFDVIKTRLQSHDGLKKNLVPKYNGVVNAFKIIYKQEGIPGLYRGVLFTLVAQSLSSFLFFGLYGMRKKAHQDKSNTSNLSIVRASAEAGIIASFLTTPLWVLKTRMLLNVQSNTNGIRNLKSCFSEIYFQYGLTGFYRGISLSLLLSSHGIIQIIIYEKLDKIYNDYFSHNYKNIIKPSFNGFLSKMTTTLILYPLSTIRTRIQQNQFIKEEINETLIFDKQHSKYKNIQDVIFKIWGLEGFKGFYKGITASIMRSAPANAVFFFFYEFFKNQIYKF